MAGAVPVNGTRVGLNSDRGVQQQAAGVRHRADPGMRHVYLRLVFLHVGGELAQRVRRKILSGDQHHRVFGNEPDRLEIRLRLVGKIGILHDRGGMRPHVAKNERVAVGRGARPACHAGGAAGADNILDDELLAELL